MRIHAKKLNFSVIILVTILILLFWNSGICDVGKVINILISLFPVSLRIRIFTVEGRTDEIWQRLISKIFHNSKWIGNFTLNSRSVSSMYLALFTELVYKQSSSDTLLIFRLLFWNVISCLRKLRLLGEMADSISATGNYKMSPKCHVQSG